MIFCSLRACGWLILASALISPGLTQANARPAASTSKPPPKSQAAPAKKPAPKLSVEDEAALRWEQEAMHRGRFVCTNPNHHHQFSSQMMMLREDAGDGDLRRLGD